MTHLPQLIQDLALILVSSFAGKTIFLSGLRKAPKGIVGDRRLIRSLI